MRSDQGYSSLARLEAVLRELAAADVTDWTDAQVRAGLLALLPAANQLCAVVSLLVGVFDARGLSDADACRSTRAWLTAFGRLSQGAATGFVSRARLLRQLPALAEAACQGRVSAEHLGKRSI